MKCITADADNDCHASVNLVNNSKGSTSFLALDGRTEKKHLIVRIGNCEAEVANSTSSPAIAERPRDASCLS